MRLLTGTANQGSSVDILRRGGARALTGLLLAAGLCAGVPERGFAADDDVKVKAGFRIHEDWAWILSEGESGTPTGALEDGMEIRRARIELSGTLYQRTEFRAMADFAGSKVKLTDAYMGLTGLPALGTVRVGHMKEPFGLEMLVSSNDVTFMERSVASAFFPARNSGMLATSTLIEERATWAAGVFRESDDAGNARGDGGYNLTARVTGLPWVGTEGDLVHLGLGLSKRDPVDDVVEYASVPESHLAPEFAATGEIPGVESTLLAGVEAAVVRGMFSVQGEGVVSSLDAPGAGDPRFSAWYVQVSVVPTGERREYKRAGGIFGSVRPARNYLGPEKGPGALELSARVSRLDLVDASIDGGRLTDWTLGANWYLNPRARIMVNYVFADLDGAADARILQTRFQVNY